MLCQMRIQVRTNLHEVLLYDSVNWESNQNDEREPGSRDRRALGFRGPDLHGDECHRPLDIALAKINPSGR